MSDYRGAALFPKATNLLADTVYDADWLRADLEQRGIPLGIPSIVNRKMHIPHDTALYRLRHKVENIIGKPKDRRLTHTFMSGLCIAATSNFWLPQ